MYLNNWKNQKKVVSLIIININMKILNTLL